MLHVLDGDATRPAFDGAHLPGHAVVWREALLEGPAPRALRGVDEALTASDAAAARGEEIVVWFDADLFCRVNAAFFAARYPDAKLRNAIGAHTRVTDMRGCFDRRLALDRRLADVWQAYASPDPRPLVALARDFPWLRLHLARFPHADDGLNALERRILGLLRDDGPLPFDALFARVARDEFSSASYGLGDAEVRATLTELGPLVHANGEVAVTAEGRAVLAGREDRLRAAPVTRWLGGCQVGPGGAGWRWDGDALVRKP